MYTGSIAIPVDEWFTPQLVFLFLVTTDLNEPFQSLACQVTLPGAEPFTLNAPTPNDPVDPELLKLGARRRIYRIPMVLSRPVLRPGRIESKIIHEKGEFSPIGMPFIVKATLPPYLKVQDGQIVVAPPELPTTN
jgi:hypothetical protein